MSDPQTLPSPPRTPPPGPVAYEAFLDWCDEDTFAEWVDGAILVMSPPSTQHQRIARFLTNALDFFVTAHELGEVMPAPFQMKLPEGSGREPDLIFVAAEHADRLGPKRLDGPADLVVEIVSPTSLARDRGTKFREYEAAGVPAYWLVDPEREQVEAYALGADGRYRTTFAGRTGRVTTDVLPGCWIEAAWLWGDLPPVIDALRAWGLVG
jgi:Uma2 family endonuclease